VSKETYYSVKRDLLQCQKRPITVSKETYWRECVLFIGTEFSILYTSVYPPAGAASATVSKETYYSVKRDLLQWIEFGCWKQLAGLKFERVINQPTDQRCPSEVHTIYVLRYVQCQKRPITVSKETYYSVKRDLLQCQKRPFTVSKETYYSEVHAIYVLGYIRSV